MGDLGFSEMVVIVLLIVILFGPKKIPEIARELGHGIRKMKSAMEDIKTEIMKETDTSVSDIKKEIEQVKNSVSDINPVNDIKKQITEVSETVNKDLDGAQPKPQPKLPPQDDDTYEGPVSRK